MTIRQGILLLFCFALAGCGGKAEPPAKVVASVNDYQITLEEFNEGYMQSAYASRPDQPKSRRDYLENLINQKLILQNAQKRNLDKDKEFLKSIERFWEQSLLTMAIGIKTREINGALQIPEDQIRRLYDQMVKEGLTTKSFDDMYPQIKWQASRQFEAQALAHWMDELRRGADVKVNEGLFQAGK